MRYPCARFRDMDSLCAAGIPIAATAGINGGYELAERFTLNNQIISRQDYSYILTALNGLATATGDRGISDIYEKISPAADENQTGIILDFSVLQEGTTDSCRSFRQRSAKERR